MFGIKIISEERYLSEQKAAQKMEEIHEELVRKNVRLEADIKSLREQNSKLRVLNGNNKMVDRLRAMIQEELDKLTRPQYIQLELF